jgi:hypothetical protein
MIYFLLLKICVHLRSFAEESESFLFFQQVIRVGNAVSFNLLLAKKNQHNAGFFT